MSGAARASRIAAAAARALFSRPDAADAELFMAQKAKLVPGHRAQTAARCATLSEFFGVWQGTVPASSDRLLPRLRSSSTSSRPSGQQRRGRDGG